MQERGREGGVAAAVPEEVCNPSNSERERASRRRPSLLLPVLVVPGHVGAQVAHALGGVAADVAAQLRRLAALDALVEEHVVAVAVALAAPRAAVQRDLQRVPWSLERRPAGPPELGGPRGLRQQAGVATSGLRGRCKHQG